MTAMQRVGTTLVWIDAAEAIIVRLQGSRAVVEREASEVPAHHRATGHVRHDPSIRHGGGGRPQTADEPRRLHHLKRFVTGIAARLSPEDELLILGPGNVHEQLAREVARADARHGRNRDVSCEVSSRLTDRQLIERLRRLAGIAPRRRSVGPGSPGD